MADFKGTVLTQAGRNILAKALTGAQLQFTKVQLGDGVWDESINPENLTALVSSKIDLPINDIEITGDGTARIRVLLTNTGLTEGFFTRELGIFAKDPETGEETLYAVSYAENPDFIPSDGVTKVENIFDVYTVISNTQNVTAVISDTVVLATKQDIEEHNQDPNAHNGLINADKVDGFDASPTPSANTIPVADANGSLKDWIADSELLAKIKNVDGSGSGLDADLLRGLPADFTCSKTESGYTKLPNGLIIQWIKLNGTLSNYASFDINFPISFPNAVLGFGWMEAGSGGSWLIIKFDTISTSGGHVALRTLDSSDNYAYQGYIIVIGY